MREHDQDAGQTAPHLDRLTGAILDHRYRIDEKLAAGGFGSIYRATDLVMGREVALKVLHGDLAADAVVVERFRREAAALARLRDPHTITMYDVGQAVDGTRYIVMELLRGESLLETFLARRRLPWRRVARIARGVCSSLREAHALGIVHRDLKPANIYLENHALESDFVKVLDFGIAKMMRADEAPDQRALTLNGEMIGTYDYMPPEQLIGAPCTPRSDVFTLGVVIYEMIAGERPFGQAKGPATMLMAVLGTKPVPLARRAQIPPALDRLVLRALARDPEDRMDVGAFDDEVERILEEEDARFEDDDPTWIDMAPHPDLPAPAKTLIGAVPAIPRTPLPMKPAGVAAGSKPELPPVPPRARMATGTSPIANKRSRSVVWPIAFLLAVVAVLTFSVYLLATT
jgi:serine/threonine-protein kinase